MAERRASSPRVGVLDSGVGGLSVLAALRARLDGVSLFYASDSAGYPYGTKSEAEVISLATAASIAFAQKAALDVLVIACNTASTVTLPFVRAKLNIPVVGVVPAIKPAALSSRTGTIGLLATPGTVTRPYTDELIRTFASQCHVLRHGTRELVDLAEAKLRGETLDLAKVRGALVPLFEADAQGTLDTVVLGCTHFPLLLDELKAVAPREVRWIESGPAIAERVAFLLKEARLALDGEVEPGKAYFTRLDQHAEALRETLARFGLREIESLP